MQSLVMNRYVYRNVYRTYLPLVTSTRRRINKEEESSSQGIITKIKSTTASAT
jgi:hypothetical protein